MTVKKSDAISFAIRVKPERVISCQPVTESIRDTRQTNFEECCPCSRDDGSDFRDPDMSPNSPMGSFNQEADDCPCRFSEIDSQVSPSIFRPFILRNSQPSEREQQLKQKPLLQPEVGLASSVLETIQKATDEEYKEALEREASRSLVEIESGYHDSEPAKLAAINTNSPLDPLFDNASPVLKNIMKLKDVELLPPKELFGKHLSEDKLKLSDLNVAASENDVKVSDVNENKNENDVELDTRKVSDSEENVLDQTESEEESTTDVIINHSHGIQTCPEKGNSLTTSKDALIEEMQRRLDDCLKSARKAQVDVYKIDPNDTAEHFEYDSKEADNESEMEDSIAETSHNVNEQISQEEVDNRRDEIDSSNLQKNLNSEGDQNMAVTVTTQPKNEKDVTIQDLQNLSDSLLQQEQENNIKDIRIPTPIENETIFEENNENKDSSIDSTNEDKSASSELDPTDTEIDENQASLEDDDDPISNESSLDEKQENDNSESSKYINFQIGDTKDNDNFVHDSDTTLPKDSETNEMSSQASNSKYNTIIAPLNDNLKGPTLQDTFSLFKTPLQIPSLEEIKQGITDIIDAGQKESEDFQQTDFDPLNESSNRNSVLSNPLEINFAKSNYLGKPLTDRYIRPFQNARNNIAEYKSIVDTSSLKPLITEPFDHPSMLRGYPSSLASDRSNFAGNKNLKASSDATRISSLDDITRFFQNQNLLKPTNINLPKTNLLKSPSFHPQRINSLADDLKYRLDSLKPDFKQANHGNQLLGKPRSEKDDLLLTMSKKHEDMKQKLQALHFDFNDRLASMYKRLNDQKKIQSVNIPTFKTKDNSLGLPKTASNKERGGQNLNSNSLAKLDNSFLSQPQLLQDHTSMKKKFTPKPKSIYKVKASTGPLKERENGHIKYPNLSENHKLNMNKQKTFTPVSKVKISFNTTPKPFSSSSSNLQKSQDPIKIPSRLSESERTADLNSNLKDISKAFRSRFQQFIDLNHSPSELIETKQLNEDLSNTEPRINSKQANSDFAQNLKQMQDTKKTESPLISNLREALKARLQNITNTHAKPFRNPVESTNLREDDAVVLPSNVKTSVLSNPLLENKSYKCTMICSKDK
ncbi:uncharacterized protein PF11_0213-like [Papilio machaon]|uniref:uncharacterized protein PF11_0213-like n=1 Tax=Papilio machaon TaxID=76193 RepID=UPI001E664BDF|nr:uncharacterized protein PF11_0213-like [Papilio machaon]